MQTEKARCEPTQKYKFKSNSQQPQQLAYLSLSCEPTQKYKFKSNSQHTYGCIICSSVANQHKNTNLKAIHN